MWGFEREERTSIGKRKKTPHNSLVTLIPSHYVEFSLSSLKSAYRVKWNERKEWKMGCFFTFSYWVLLVYSENSPALLLPYRFLAIFFLDQSFFGIHRSMLDPFRSGMPPLLRKSQKHMWSYDIVLHLWNMTHKSRPHALHAGSDFVLQQVAHV